MVDIIRPDFGQPWAEDGEKLAPPQEKMALGWVQEMMPFQYENYLQGRQDDAILYLLQKGIAEYSPSQEYTAQKSVVLYQGAVYLATQTVTGVLPSVSASWKRVSTISDSAGVVTIAGGGTGATSAAQARTNLGLGSASLLNADVVVQKDSNGDFSAGVITASLAGNASSADKLKTPRQISLTGSVTSSAVPFDGSSNLTIPITGINASGLTSGTVPVGRLDNAVTKTSSTGFARLPAGGSTERGTPEQAGFRFNTTLNVPEYYDGSAWQATTATRSDLLGGYRFETTVWAGKAENIPEGFVQCSGQQLLDLAFPTVRADVVASQFFCTETEWQADPYKRATHWSLGDGDETTGSWMRCPDKNGVQAGNVGAFYGVGSNPAGALTGTAVTDAGRNLTGGLGDTVAFTAASGAFVRGTVSSISGVTGGFGTYSISLDASRQWPVADEFRPRTWYGIWVIRMYGRVFNMGGLDAPALNARMDMIDTRVATLEESLTQKGRMSVIVGDLNGTVATFLVPEILKTGKALAHVYLTAGGESGAAGATTSGGAVGGRGGAGGITMWAVVDLSGIDEVVVTLGAGGARTTTTTNNPGGASSFGTLFSCNGRTGAVVGDTSRVSIYTPFEGGNGQLSSLNNSTSAYGGAGGASYWNPGGIGGGGGPGVGSRGSGGGGGTTIGEHGGAGRLVIIY